MLSIEVARRLAEAGLVWRPAPGDRFVIPQPELLDQVFVLSELVADLYRFGDDEVIGFNGTTEWALDSVRREDVVWLPREDQLRAALGARFRSLEQGSTSSSGGTPSGGTPSGSTVFTVTVLVAGEAVRVSHGDVEHAYALAWLALLGEG